MSIFIGQLIGFAVIAYILWRYVVPPMKALMAKQQEAVRTALAESAEAARNSPTPMRCMPRRSPRPRPNLPR